MLLFALFGAGVQGGGWGVFVLCGCVLLDLLLGDEGWLGLGLVVGLTGDERWLGDCVLLDLLMGDERWLGLELGGLMGDERWLGLGLGGDCEREPGLVSLLG